MKVAEADIIVAAGEGADRAAHWQNRWAGRFSTAITLAADGDPADAEAVDRLHRAVLMATRPVVLIAHSRAVAAVALVAAELVDTKVRGAFLVSPPGPDGPELPRDPLPFASMLIVSSDDPACPLEHAADLAACWGSDFHVSVDAGHIDAESGHGPWPEGLILFTRLMQRLRT